MNPWNLVAEALGWIFAVWIIGSFIMFVVRDLFSDWRNGDR